MAPSIAQGWPQNDLVPAIVGASYGRHSDPTALWWTREATRDANRCPLAGANRSVRPVPERPARTKATHAPRDRGHSCHHQVHSRVIVQEIQDTRGFARAAKSGAYH